VRLISLEAENEKVVGISRLPEVAGSDEEAPPEGGAAPPVEGGGAPPAPETPPAPEGTPE
jgi:hypothetical protein